jgi:hypothetical protein
MILEGSFEKVYIRFKRDPEFFNVSFANPLSLKQKSFKFSRDAYALVKKEPNVCFTSRIHQFNVRTIVRTCRIKGQVAQELNKDRSHKGLRIMTRKERRFAKEIGS